MSTSQPERKPRGPTLADEFLAGLLWPRLLSAVPLAARPQRLLISFFLVVIAGAIGHLRLGDGPPFLEALIGAKARALQLIFFGIESLDRAAILRGLGALITDVPKLMLTDYPVSTFLLGIPIVIVVATLGGAVCRSVACEFSQEIVHPWPRALAFGVARWKSFLGVLILPGAVVGFTALLLAIAGWIFFGGVPLLDVVGALLFGFALVLGLLAALVLILAVLAWPTLLPAAACEGTDAIDAAQRALAYAFAKPLRLLWYLAVAGAIGVAAVGVAWGLAEGTDRFTRGAAAAWAGDSGVRALTGEYPPEGAYNEAGEPRQPRGTTAAAARIVEFWSGLITTLAIAYCASYALTSGTLIYLFMRQVCDGQHYSELWTPGLIESSIRASMRPAPGAEAPIADAPEAED